MGAESVWYNKSWRSWSVNTKIAFSSGSTVMSGILSDTDKNWEVA